MSTPRTMALQWFRNGRRCGRTGREAPKAKCTPQATAGLFWGVSRPHQALSARSRLIGP